MRATDVEPSRLGAAQQAARDFVADQPAQVRVGIVAVAGTAAVVQSPTDNCQDIYQAIERFQLQRGTALGSGLINALAALLPNSGIDAQMIISGAATTATTTPAAEPPRKAAPKVATGVATAGPQASLAIVLLSDGQSNTGPDPLEMAKIALDRGVRVYTVGVGTPEGAVLTANGWSMRVRLDEEELKRIAAATGAEYFRAGSAADLKKVYQSLSARLSLEKKQKVEVTALFAALGAALAMVGATLSLLWFSRIL